MPSYICTACGVEYGESERPPEVCRICEDDRRHVNRAARQWTVMGDLRREYANTVQPDGGLTGIGTDPEFAIGQRALLVETPAGNVLWDCISLIDSATVAAVQEHGGVRAVAISHPHFCGSMVEWSRAFGGIPVYLHASDREWVMRHDPAIVFWSGETHGIAPGLTLVRCGGHFPGSSVLHWDGGGALLAGDTLQVSPGRRRLSFMRGCPNLIPMPASEVRRIAAALEPFAFDRIYGGWWGLNVMQDAKQALRRSVERYLAAVE
ncbi:MAG: MBL fold metallo-hydrolase [Bryobacteraceae bacterium]